MIIKGLDIENFRNIEKMNIEPCENVNVIYGENAQGKTNIIESIWLFTGCRSFRGTKDKELIKFGESKAKTVLDFFSENRNQQMKIEIAEKKVISKNDIAYSSPSKCVGEFPAVVFSPVHLSLIKEGPSERRKFLDIAISQLRPQYASLLTKYNRVITQRNALLKDVHLNTGLYDMLDIFDEEAAAYAAKIAFYRTSYLEKLTHEVKKIYSGLSSGKEIISLEYIQCEERENFTAKDAYLEKIKKARKTDIIAGTTSVGTHREDIEIKIDGNSARKFGSQGQQRSCALALKLGEASMIKNTTSLQPVALLDDVMSELDVSRQDYILNHIKDWQVFITCCEMNTIRNLKEGRSFHIKGGRVIETR